VIHRCVWERDADTKHKYRQRAGSCWRPVIWSCFQQWLYLSPCRVSLRCTATSCSAGVRWCACEH